MNLKPNCRACRDLLGHSLLPLAVITAWGVRGEKIINVIKALQIGGYFISIVVDRLIFFHPDQKAVAIKRRVLQRALECCRALLFGNHIERWLTWRNDE